MRYMNKFISIVLSLILIFSVICIKSFAGNEQDFMYKVSGNTIEITKCNLNDKEVVIPDSIDGYNVTSVDFLAFRACSNVEKIVIGKNITTIDDGAFSPCSSLKNIVVSDQNTAYSTIDDVLYNKNKTEIVCYPTQKSSSSFKMPDSVEVIRMNAFLNCVHLKEVELSQNLKNISMNAFSGCENLECVVMFSKVRTIEEYAFSGCLDKLHILYHGSLEQWNDININSDEKQVLSNNVCCKDSDKNFNINLTDKDIEVSYTSNVPFNIEISDESVIKLSDIKEDIISEKYKLTAKITPLKSGQTTISFITDNNFILCNFVYSVTECYHSNFHFLSTEKAATCTQNGKEIYVCDFCDYTESRIVNATGHTFGDWKVEVKATKEKDGLEVRTCICGETETRIIPKLSSSNEATDKTNNSISIGDVDGNKKVNATDARKILRHVAGVEKINSDQLNYADVDKNNKITASDARRVLRNVAGLEVI